MRAGLFSDASRYVFGSLWASLRRLVMLHLSGGSGDTWQPEFVTSDVIDINTRLPVRGHVMQKIVDGRWAYRVMTDEEYEDHIGRTAW